mmetsp:Transcript_27401/g.64730  ORF Transcript_27401/g.64730 Transcript_27401/m.64730 type:complete len:203 (+) Transcript_27401:92-700(+)
MPSVRAHLTGAPGRTRCRSVRRRSREAGSEGSSTRARHASGASCRSERCRRSSTRCRASSRTRLPSCLSATPARFPITSRIRSAWRPRPLPRRSPTARTAWSSSSTPPPETRRTDTSRAPTPSCSPSSRSSLRCSRRPPPTARASRSRTYPRCRSSSRTRGPPRTSRTTGSCRRTRSLARCRGPRSQRVSRRCCSWRLQRPR